MAIECRTGKERLTINDLRKAKENRSAEAALLLAERSCALPKDAEELGSRLYWEERTVVPHHDPARPDSGILLATALQVVRMFAPLRASATGIETEVGRIRGYAPDIEGELAHSARRAVGPCVGVQ